MLTKRKITEDYISGFVDGEGCFSLSLRKDKGRYFYWKAIFAIVIRNDDDKIIKQIKKYFDCGSISYSKDCIRYQITDTTELMTIIIPFFEKFPLIGKKGDDFKLWREAVFIINKNKIKKVNSEKGIKGFVKNQWNVDDIKRLDDLRNEMKKFKSGLISRTFKY